MEDQKLVDELASFSCFSYSISESLKDVASDKTVFNKLDNEARVCAN